MKDIDVLQEQLENHKKSLKSVDESIKKLDGSNKIKDDTIQSNSASNRTVKINSIESLRNPVANKRKISDLADYRGGSKRTSNNRSHDNDSGDEDNSRKPTVRSSVVSSNMPIKSKEDLIRIQNKHNGSEQRNKRIIGVILGTLQKFKTDDTEKSSTTQAIHRKELEKKIEIKKVEEKKRIIEEKRKLEDEKYKQTRNIQIIENKIQLTSDFESWKTHHIRLKKFIRTKSKPHIYYLPKQMNEKTEKLLEETRTLIEEEIAKKLKETEIEIEMLNKESELLNKSDNDKEEHQSKGQDQGSEGRANLDDKENKAHEDTLSDSELDDEKNNINVRIGEDDDEEEVAPPAAASSSIMEVADLAHSVEAEHAINNSHNETVEQVAEVSINTSITNEQETSMLVENTSIKSDI